MRHAQAIGDSPLNLLIQRRRRDAELARQVARIALEAGEPLPTAPRATLAGDAKKLRGIPAIGCRGISGTMRGTDPLGAILARSDDIALVRSLATLVRDDVDGTSPGTQPEQALLDAEEETLRTLAGRAPAEEPEHPRWTRP